MLTYDVSKKLFQNLLEQLSDFFPEGDYRNRAVYFRLLFFLDGKKKEFREFSVWY